VFIALRIFASLIALLALAMIFEYGVWRNSLPQTSGVVQLSGPRGPIDIHRDENGVPHISADSPHDLNFGLGFVHAQDRLFQMELNRRLGHGRLAELVGEAGLPIDRMMRTFGFGHRAQQAFEALPEDKQENLQAYANGVNAFLAQHRGSWPPEFIVIGAEPGPWSPVDTMVWFKIMWLDLSGNARYELNRAQLLTKLSSDQVKSIYPDYPGENHGPLPNLSEIYAATNLDQLAAILPPKPLGYGSNNWVVDGNNTQSGKPLLANDPHLGLSTPSIWYLTHLHNRKTGKNMVGVGFPGAPGIVLGRNDRIAWGFTNTASDVQDLFIEKLVGEDQYLTPEGPADFITREEVINIRGKEPLVLNVRETRHGPVMSDVYRSLQTKLEPGYVVSLQWTALQDTDPALVAMDGLMSAQNFEEFQAAGRNYFGPEQNMIYADVDGNIGYYAPALVPVRHPDNKIKGRVPSPGWDTLYDWQGYIPYADLPTRYNPAGGVIATANEKIVDDDYPYYLTRDWSQPYRGNRIRAELAKSTAHDIASFSALHMNQQSDYMRELLPAVLAVLPDDHAAQDILKGWDGMMSSDSAAAIVMARFNHLYQAMLIEDELGDLKSAVRRQLPRLVSSSLRYSLPSDPSADQPTAMPLLGRDTTLSWCDNTTTDSSETCADIALAAMDKALGELRREQGDNPEDWSWGAAHVLHQEHRPMSNIPGLRDIFALSAATGGGRFTVNVAGDSLAPNGRHRSSFGPSYRGIFDLADLDNSVYVQPTGQSGHPLSAHHSDLFPKWLHGDYIKIPTSGYEKQAKHLQLRPKH